MTAESETPRITELHVRMDCHGCEHKIRKTLRAIDGISEVYIDQANHKITVVGMADPERIVKAIRKTKRVPTIFSHTDPSAEAQPPPAEGEASPPADPPADAPPAEAAPSEPTPETKEVAKEAPPAEPPAMDAIVMNKMHDYPYGDGHHLYREHWVNHPMDMHGVRYDAAPYHVTHSYSYHSTSPYIAEYGYGGSPDQEGRSYSYNYYPGRGKGDGSQITSMFSDENPNACSIV
ncbi:hypothetical protein SETIT_5G023600v2 [Setaria italica]|uniref:HMA domain-containing protein n=1 Tax=Setaria italica TaxID=4555 RepID=K3XQ75_SETIT|nr:heavy metal-associated isoprenylated plant protein 5 [Setaria italica]RCV23644.1 hypothetical protein SETIT_5G023600v2 [Setaria italica]RCV23645.1 hypothetical protein SETIT_5G023600v2 [Setaria italica]